jgi:hypothetical protein
MMKLRSSAAAVTKVPPESDHSTGRADGTGTVPVTCPLADARTTACIPRPPGLELVVTYGREQPVKGALLPEPVNFLAEGEGHH